jgi:phosphomannomutase
MSDLQAIVKAYDIRGLVPSQLDDDLAESLGRAMAVEIPGEAVVVGRDMRPTSPKLADAFMRGVRRQGMDTVDLGLASTDLVYYASGRLGLPGVMVTASHNPAGYNGMKLCRAGAEPVSLETGLARIRDRALDAAFPLPGREGGARGADLLDAFAQHVRSFVDAGSMRPLKVAVDAGNGMAGHVVPTVFDGLPIDVVPLYFELDGTFPNHPADPLVAANLVDLQRAVREHGCDMGMAFDGDADRLICVDENGDPVSPSLLTAVIAEAMLRKEPGSTILYSLVCSKVVPETVVAAGGYPVRTRAGHSYVKALMAETGAFFAGEHSGHYYFRDNYRADSALIAAVVLFEALSETDGPMSALTAPYDRYVATGEISVHVADVAAATAAVAAAFAGEGAVDRADGLTVDAGPWWFNLRPSNTEPLLRLNAEAPDRRTLARVRDRVLDVLRNEEPT